MRALEFITGHVIFKLRYNQIYQLKTTIALLDNFLVFKKNISTNESTRIYNRSCDL